MAVCISHISFHWLWLAISSCFSLQVCTHGHDIHTLQLECISCLLDSKKWPKVYTSCIYQHTMHQFASTPNIKHCDFLDLHPHFPIPMHNFLSFYSYILMQLFYNSYDIRVWSLCTSWILSPPLSFQFGIYTIISACASFSLNVWSSSTECKHGTSYNDFPSAHMYYWQDHQNSIRATCKSTYPLISSFNWHLHEGGRDFHRDYMWIKKSCMGM